jgi:N-acetylneuraminic acid mutarotase
MRKEMDDLARRLNVVRNDMREVKDDMREVKDEVKLTQEEMEYLAKEAIERCDLFTGRQKIFVCGGRNENRLKSVESFSWPDNSWTLEPAMQETRSAASAFVHGREIYVSGGLNDTKATDTIETFNVDKEQLEWTESPVKMPLKCDSHKMVCHENSAILTGGFGDGENVSDGIYEISLDPPHNSKLLTQMPEPRCYHGCEIVNNQVMVAGGRTSNYHRDTKNTVYAYDLHNNECKTLPPLPFPISEMASVSYKGNIILIGGANEKGQTLNSVVMYDVKTGKIKMLPCLNHKRAGSAAVITGNVIIVMGGYDYETKTRLSSVEYLDLSTNIWRELSPMTTKRSAPSAVLKPIS